MKIPKRSDCVKLTFKHMLYLTVVSFTNASTTSGTILIVFLSSGCPNKIVYYPIRIPLYFPTYFIPGISRLIYVLAGLTL